MNTITYHSTNAPASKAWLAYVVLPSGDKWRVFAEGATEDEAKSKIIALYEREREKARSEATAAADAPASHPWGESGKHHLAGLVWVVNAELKDKRRIKPDELDNYLARGYIKGGPRTQI